MPTSRRRLAGLAAAAIFVLAACSGSSATSAPAATNASVASPTPTATPTPTPSATPAASPSGTPEATGVATSLDPCTLVTAQEAGQLAGVTFGPGKAETTSGNGKICVYGYQTLNVFTVIVGQAPDVATAQAEKAAALAEIQTQATKGVTITQLPNIADGAVYVAGGGTISGQTIAISAIYVLKGTVFFGFSDLVLNKQPPSSAALQAQAQTVLGRLP